MTGLSVDGGATWSVSVGSPVARSQTTSDPSDIPVASRVESANKDAGTLSAIDVATDTVVGYVQVGEEPHGVAVGPDGLVYVTAKHANKVAVVDPVNLTIVREIADPALVGPHQILFIPETMS